MAYYNAKAERERKESMTAERILNIAKSRGEFTVSLRYRDDWLRARCGQLKSAGKLVGGRRDGRSVVYYPAAQLVPSPDADQGPGEEG